MQILAFSDLHRSDAKAASLVERASSDQVDLVIGAGDFASQHEGLDEAIASLAAISKPALLVPGNNETADALRTAVSDAGWNSAIVLHGDSTEVEGKMFFGLGAGIPTTPWAWSFDLSEDEAAEALAGLPDGAVLIVHSPPKGHCDLAGSGDHLGSEAIFAAIEEKSPPLAVCGHIHEAWGQTSEVGPTRIINLGPDGHQIEL
ncbi:MAG: metallophosphoesterase family protein [bacterium]